MTNDETKSFDDEASEAPFGSDSDAVEADTSADLPGDLLGVESDEPGADYQVVDDEAEELTTPEDAIVADADEVVVDDEEQLAEAEAAAARATSTRPIRKARRDSKGTEPKTTDVAEVVPVSNRPVRKSAGAEVLPKGQTPKKGRATAKQPGTVAARSRRTTPPEFVRQSVAELRKVVWPTGDQLRQYFIVVLLFVLFIIAYVGLLDLFFGWGLLKLFGGN